jgi:RHS repeat-associated protein
LAGDFESRNNSSNPLPLYPIFSYNPSMVALAKAHRKSHTPCRPAQYSGLRFYSPEISRWLSGDPIGENGGLNLYVFSLNGPVTKVDILGRETIIATEPTDPNDPGLVSLPALVQTAVGGSQSPPIPWWPSPGPISPPDNGEYQNPPPGMCSIRVCCTPVAGGIGRHCYVRIQSWSGRLFGCRGGLPEGCAGPLGSSSGEGEPYPSHCSQCCGLWGPIVTQCDTYTRGGGTPLDENFGNQDQRCRLLETSSSACTTVWNCLQNRAEQIESQCYRYRLLFGARNSNTAAHDLLSHCITGGPSIPLPSGVDAPGWRDFNEDDDTCPITALEELLQ